MAIMKIGNVAILGISIILLCAAPMLAQIRVAPFGRVRMGRPAMIRGMAQADEASSAEEQKFSDGPGLKTDPEAQQLLSRAEQFIADERYDLAAVLWQKVLDDAGDNLVSVDDRLYISLRRQVEQRLSRLPPLALKTYRVTADGEAQAVLSAAGAEQEETALAQVVRRFFISSLGDDAAYKLGCLALDRYDFVGASRLFAKVLEEHPDASIPRSDLLIRLAVAAARVGDTAEATKLLNEIDRAVGPRPTRSLLNLVASDIQSGGNARFVSARVAGATIPAAATERTLTALWSHEYPMLFQEQALHPQTYAMHDGRQSLARQSTDFAIS